MHLVAVPGHASLIAWLAGSIDQEGQSTVAMLGVLLLDAIVLFGLILHPASLKQLPHALDLSDVRGKASH